MDKSQLSILQPFDILGYSGGDYLSSAIRIFEMFTEDERISKGFQGIIEGIKEKSDQKVPIHIAMIYDISNPNDIQVCEQTWPYPCIRPLNKDFENVVAIYRCKWLTKETNPECDEMLKNNLKTWWTNYVNEGKKASYGIANLITFPFLNADIDEQHLVCSQAAAQSLITEVDSDPRFPCNFPDFWKHPKGQNEVGVGKVSPLDFDTFFKANNQCIWKQ